MSPTAPARDNDRVADGTDTLAPVALFAHRRREHLAQALAALRANPVAGSTDLTIFVDGPRNDAEAVDVAAVVEVARAAEGFGSVRVVEREANLGLARSIITGVGRLIDERGEVIVLEDDIVVAPHFLEYMNDGLRTYADDERVASIHGYVYPMEDELPETFFMRGGDCWGWATWARAWAHFEGDGTALRARMRDSGMRTDWDFDGWAGLSDMLDAQIAGTVDSWAVRWSAATYLDGMFTLYPGHTLVRNIGNDGSGSHRGESARFDAAPYAERIEVRPIPVEEDPAIQAAFEAFYRTRAEEMSTMGRLAHRLSRWLRRD